MGDSNNLIELGSIAKLKSGGTPSRQRADFWGGAVPWLSAKDLKSFRVFDSIERLTDLGAASGTAIAPEGSTLVLVRGMTLLKEVPIALTTRDVCFNQDVKAVVPSAAIDSRFLAYTLAQNARRLQAQVSVSGHGTGRILGETLDQLSIWLPSLPEQRRIAAVLDAWDEAIALNERLVAANRRRRDGVRQQLLAPAFSAGPSRRGWSEASITDIADVRGGGTPSSGEPAFWDGEVAWCTPTDLTGLSTRFLGSTAKSITREGLRASAASVLPEGSVILCSRASVGECALSTIPMATNQGFQSLVPHHRGDAPFLYHLMRQAKPQLLRISAGSTFLEFGRNEMRRMKLALPTREERAGIGSFLDALTDEIDLLAARTDLLRTQKRGLMQRLLTGALRVPESFDALMPAPPPLEAAE